MHRTRNASGKRIDRIPFEQQERPSAVGRKRGFQMCVSCAAFFA
jgi:hypothetical protein